MSRDTLLATLKKYEEKQENKEFKPKTEENHTITNDLNRSDFSFSKFHKSCLISKLYLHILNSTFKNLPISYFQGMMEIASVLVEVYFQDKAAGFRSKYKDLDELAPSRLKIENISENEMTMFEEFLKANEDIYTRFKNSLINILEKKFLFFTKDEFKNYNENNKIFIKLMKTKFKKSLNEIGTMKYMNHTLTFFKRMSENSNVVFTLFNIILNSDSTIVFSILANYIDKADKFNSVRIDINQENRDKYLISSIDEEDIKKILSTHELFLKCKTEVNTSKVSKTTFLVIGAAVGCTALAWLLSDKRKDGNK